MIEKVTLTNTSTGKTSTQCIRLVDADVEDEAGAEGEEASAQVGTDTQLDKGQGIPSRIVIKMSPESDRHRDERFLKANRTIQWQILEALDKAGHKGMTRTVVILSHHARD